MSKKVTVTAVANSVQVEGHYLVRGNDGQIYAASASKGDVLMDGGDTYHDVVLNKKGVAAVQKAAAIFEEIARHRKALNNISTSQCSEYDGGLSFEDEDGNPAVAVGCTAVDPDDLPKYMKALGI